MDKRELWLIGKVRDPELFARHLLGIDLWDTQVEILHALAEHRRVAVKACHASSKTFTAAIATLWWLTRYPDGVVLTTAPTWRQVERQLWAEIQKAVAGARIAYPQPTQTGLRLSSASYALGLSTDQGVRFQGFHGRILVVIDEATGVDAEIWEAIEGIRAGGDVHVLALGNPTVPRGPFYEAFTTARDSWSTFTISAFDSPNLHGLTLEQLLELPEDELDRNERPYLVTRRWVREQWEAWGQHGAPQWQSRVLGEFPRQGDDALLPLAFLEGWASREAVDDPRGLPLEVGIDVAGPGESETVAAIRQGGQLLHLQAWRDSDPLEAVAELLRPLRSRTGYVKVDAIGMGHHFGMSLSRYGLDVLLVNVGVPSNDRERFRNLKAELYWGLRERVLVGDVSGLADELAYAQLASLRYEHTPSGQVAMESKDSMLKRGVRSPDRAEAIMLAYAPLQPPPEERDYYYEEGVKIGPQV